MLPFQEKLAGMLESNSKFVYTTVEHDAGRNIIEEVGRYTLVEGETSGLRLETEQEREQEQEQQKEVQARRDQQIEVEKFVDRDYSRGEEAPTSWPFDLLGKTPGNEAGSWSYPLENFQLRYQSPLQFPSFCRLSSNYFNPNWHGLRRIKNVIILLEWVPSKSLLSIVKRSDGSKNIRDNNLSIVEKVFGLFAFEGKGNTMSMSDLRGALANLTDRELNDVSDEETIALLKEYGSIQSGMNLDNFQHLVTSGRVHPIEKGRHFVAVSLREAETIRRVMHMRRNCVDVVAGTDAELAIHYSPDATDKESMCIFDASLGWYKKDTTGLISSKSPITISTGATAYQIRGALTSYRFFDCDTNFPPSGVHVLIRCLEQSTPRNRERFFTSNIGHRRRFDCKWKETSLSNVFSLLSEWHVLKQMSYSSFIRNRLTEYNVSIWKAFENFDCDDNGFISCTEMFGAFKWLRIPDQWATAEDAVDYIEGADKSRTFSLDYKEFTDEILYPRHDEGEINEKNGTCALDTLPPIEACGADEIREIIIRRMRRRQASARQERLYWKNLERDLQRVSFFEQLERRNETLVGGSNPVIYSQQTSLVYEFSFTAGQSPFRMSTSGNAANIVKSSTQRDPLSFPVDHWHGSTWLEVGRGSEVQILLPLPESHSDIDPQKEVYNISATILFTSFPVKGNHAALFRFSPAEEVNARYKYNASIFIDSSGYIVPSDNEYNETLSTEERIPLITGKWCVISCDVDVAAGKIDTYVNGHKSSSSAFHNPTLLALGSRLTLFGGCKASQNCGGNMATISVTRGRLLGFRRKAICDLLTNFRLSSVIRIECSEKLEEIIRFKKILTSTLAAMKKLCKGGLLKSAKMWQKIGENKSGNVQYLLAPNACAAHLEIITGLKCGTRDYLTVSDTSGVSSLLKAHSKEVGYASLKFLTEESRIQMLLMLTTTKNIPIRNHDQVLGRKSIISGEKRNRNDVNIRLARLGDFDIDDISMDGMKTILENQTPRKKGDLKPKVLVPTPNCPYCKANMECTDNCLYHQYICNGCSTSSSGKRWHCTTCHTDFCEECHEFPIIEKIKNTPITLSKTEAVECIEGAKIDLLALSAFYGIGLLNNIGIAAVDTFGEIALLQKNDEAEEESEEDE